MDNRQVGDVWTVDARLAQRATRGGGCFVDEENGKESETRMKLLRSGNGTCLVECTPLTGRTHQIRLHLLHIGHPIVGDLCYGDAQQQREYPRLMLHAHQISFQDLSGQNIDITSPTPEKFEQFIQNQ